MKKLILSLIFISLNVYSQTFISNVTNVPPYYAYKTDIQYLQLQIDSLSSPTSGITQLAADARYLQLTNITQVVNTTTNTVPSNYAVKQALDTKLNIYSIETYTTNIAVDTLQLNTSYEDGVSEGRIQISQTTGGPEVGLPGGKVNLQLGFETLERVKNVSGATILNGRAVAAFGQTGTARPNVVLADGTSTNEKLRCVYGVATEDIAKNQTGYVCKNGLVNGAKVEGDPILDTTGYQLNMPLFLSTNGLLSNTELPYPYDNILVGEATIIHATLGVIDVNIKPYKRWTNLDQQYKSIIDTNTIASASNVGRIRYYSIASNSYVDVCMQVSTNGYSWVNIQSFGW